MREFLLTRGPVEDPTFLFGVTLTVPGPVFDREFKGKLWNYFSKHQVARSGWSAVWRMEIQGRGSIHWHLLLLVPLSACSDALEHCPTNSSQLQSILAWDIKGAWHKSLRNMGAETWDPPHVVKKSGQEFRSVSSRMDLPGAERFSCHVEFDGGDQRWIRYLHDHATKQKQEQIAEDWGRHWGVIGRDGFKLMMPESVETLTDPQFWAFLRMLQRLVTGTIKCPPSPFGRKVGRRKQFGGFGAHVRFSNPETVGRMIEQARKIRD